MSQTLKDYVWVFVGCGGTFYAASPYLAVLRRRYSGRETILIDPDHVEEENYSRQWPGWNPGTSKASAAEEALFDPMTHECVTTIVGLFSPIDSLLERQTDGRPVLAIVNVDNDRARLAVADWLASRVSPGIMVVSGCERTFGQCYPGVWMDGMAVHDWRDHHPDVGQDEPSTHRCNLQDIRANALTGVCVDMCAEDIAYQLEEGAWHCVYEYYWNIVDGIKVNMWNDRLLCKKGGNHG